jgi:site-specific recombinase XerC
VSDTGATPWELFTRWIAERKPERSTVESWRHVFQTLGEHFKDRSAGSIMPEEAHAWVQSLMIPERSAGVVKRTWLNAANTVFRWALEHKHLSRNPFAGIKVTVPKRGDYERRARSMRMKRVPF